jgi:hypothetical protein
LGDRDHTSFGDVELLVSDGQKVIDALAKHFNFDFLLTIPKYCSIFYNKMGKLPNKVRLPKAGVFRGCQYPGININMLCFGFFQEEQI